METNETYRQQIEQATHAIADLQPQLDAAIAQDDDAEYDRVITLIGHASRIKEHAEYALGGAFRR
jgi:hypothetical protein